MSGDAEGTEESEGTEDSGTAAPAPVERAERAKVYNERLKTSVGALNAVAIALVGAAFVFPVIRDDDLAALFELRTWVWIAMGLGLHCVALTLLGLLRRED